MTTRLTIGMACLCFVCQAKLVAAGTTFVEIGFLPDYEYSNNPMAMTDDGSTVVGWSESRASGRAAYIWRKDVGIAPLADLIAGPIDAVTISGDGESIFIGRGDTVMRWTQSTGLAPLFDLPASTDSIHFAGSSSDGATLAGSSFANTATPSAATRSAFQWRAGVGMSIIGDEFVATGVSGDGGFVVGYRVLTPIDGRTNGIRRSIDGDETIVDTGMSFTDAIAASHDGTVVVGISGSDGFRWTDDGGAIVLGTLPGQDDATTALDVSSDGSIVVGYAEAAPQGAFIWDAANGMRSVHEILTNQGVDLSGRSFSSARFISANGRTIVGSEFINSSGEGAWIATVVPEPSSLLLALLAAPVVIAARRVAAPRRFARVQRSV